MDGVKRPLRLRFLLQHRGIGASSTPKTPAAKTAGATKRTATAQSARRWCKAWATVREELARRGLEFLCQVLGLPGSDLRFQVEAEPEMLLAAIRELRAAQRRDATD